MADMVIGPFLVRNANAAQLNDVRAVAARLPANMKSGQTIINFGARPAGAPSWAQGYNQSANSFWVNPNAKSSDRQYVIAHEYWHAWSRTHSEQETSVRQLLVGQFGNTETSTWTNDPDEGLADAFAKAMGFRAYPRYDWRAYVPVYQYQHFLDLLGGSSYTPPPPTGTPANNPTNDPNRDNARAFLMWFQNRNPATDNAFTNWTDLVSHFETSTGNHAAADYVRSVFAALHIDMNVASGVDSINNPVLQALRATSGYDDSFFAPVFDFITGFVEGISHGFYFLLVLIIGLVLLIVGFKARSPKGETA